MNLLNAALEYAELGYQVFPCVPGAKVPLTQNGYKDATTEADQIEVWWGRTPSANIGLVTHGMLVIDVDGHDNEWPFTPDRMMDLSGVPSSVTPRGGRHYLFRQPQHGVWRNTTGVLSERVDTRADGGYIIVAPSVVDGKPYRWGETCPLDSERRHLPEPPTWVLDELGKVRGHGEPIVSGANAIPQSCRNDTLTRIGGGMRRMGLGPAEILATLAATNRERCNPPLSDTEVEKIAHSVSRYDPDQTTVAVVEDHWGQMVDSSASRLEDPGPTPKELLRVPGLISDIMDFTLATAPKPNEAMAFCGALSMQAFLAGRKIKEPGGLRTNLYLLALASSGSGKDHPRKINVKIAHQIGMVRHFGDRFASAEGLEDALLVTPNMLFQTDEIQSLIRSASLAKEARLDNLVAMLMSLYTSSGSQVPMRRKAGQEEGLAISEPCLNLLGTSLPTHFYESLSGRMMSDGFFARMLIVDADEDAPPQRARDLPLPSSIVDTAEMWRQYGGGGNMAGIHPSAREISFGPGADDYLFAKQGEHDDLRKKCVKGGDDSGSSVWSRVNENARKLALIYAASEMALGTLGVITLEAAKWGVALAEHQARRMLYMASLYHADSDFDRLCLRLTRKLQDADGELSHSAALKAMRMRAKDFTDLVNTMVQRGEVQEVETQSGGAGRPYRGYRLRL